MEQINLIFRNDGVMQLSGNWQLGGFDHKWKFYKDNSQTAEYALCIEPDISYIQRIINLDFNLKT